MTAEFKISKAGNYGINVEGLEADSKQYLDENAPVLISDRSYAYTHTATLNVLTSLDSHGNETFDTYSINLHEQQLEIEGDTYLIPPDIQEFIFNKDGLYKISHIIIPTEIWLNYVLERDQISLEVYTHVYYYNTTNNKFYRYLNEVSKEVTLLEVLEANYLPSILPEDQHTTIIRSDKNTFIMYFLNECFSKLSKELLLSLPDNCNRNSDSYKQSIFNRDLLWMGINVIKYSLERGQYFEAQRIFEQLIRCNNLCDTSIINPSYGCGCNN